MGGLFRRKFATKDAAERRLASIPGESFNNPRRRPQTAVDSKDLSGKPIAVP
jgi:hypothetical protein